MGRNPSEVFEKAKILATDDFFGLSRFHVEHLVLLKLITTKDGRVGDLLEPLPTVEKSFYRNASITSYNICNIKFRLWHLCSKPPVLLITETVTENVLSH